MPVAHAETIIHAPIETVWQAMNDLPAYSQWNPFVTAIDCADSPAREGSLLTLHVSFGNGKKVVTKEDITCLQPPADSGGKDAVLEYRFLGPLVRIGAVRGRRRQSLRAMGKNKTLYISHEKLTGWLAWAAPIAQVQDGFERHAQALKARCESKTV